MVRPTGSPLSGTSSNGNVLVINSGSSSVKFALFSSDGAPSLLWSGAIERIGLRNGRFHAVDVDDATALEDSRDIPDHDAALALLLDATERHASGARVAAVEHRVVHGGPECDCPEVVTTAPEDRLHELVPLAPLHQSHNLAGIAADRKALPKVVQIAYFDTAFHYWLPRLARLTVLPRTSCDAGIRRYGFHRLSYEYILEALREENKSVNDERVIVAHLGNGASLCAFRNGRSVETTMGISTLAGLSMGTCCGDLDPGIVLYLLAKKNMSLDRVQNLFYKESGLLGLSGLSGNMQDLPAQPRHVLDPLRNSQGDRIISAEASLVDVNAFPTNEELVIARHVCRALSPQLTMQGDGR